MEQKKINLVSKPEVTSGVEAVAPPVEHPRKLWDFLKHYYLWITGVLLIIIACAFAYHWIFGLAFLLGHL